MTSDRRRGFTLIELMISLVIVVIVGGAVYSLLQNMQRVAKRQTEVAFMNGNMRAGTQLIQSELQDLAEYAVADSGDISAISLTGMTYRALRGLGETCALPAATLIKIRQSTYSGVRKPAAREGLWLYLDDDSTKVTDDAWQGVTISSMATGTCTDGSASYDLTVPTITGGDLAKIPYYPSPVRTYETMAIGQVTDNGQNWLGIRSIGNSEGSLIPVLGPLASTGLRFTYYDKNNAVTATRSAIKTILITLYGITDVAVNSGGTSGAVGTVTDSLQIRVQLRNAQ